MFVAGVQFYCEKCNRTMNADQFYGTNNKEKYPEGKLPICKKCMTMHVDNWNPDTYLWILQEADVPYIPEEWDKLLQSYGRDKEKVNGLSIVGRYLAKMRLQQHKNYRWKDNEFLQDLANKKMEEAMKRQGYDYQEIATALHNRAYDLPQEELKQFVPPPGPEDKTEEDEDYFDQRSKNGSTEDELDLTDEDRTYLRLKWGKTYRPEEWVRLEQLYNDMMNSYDIQGAGHEDNLKLLCKTSLKANQLIDIGDVEGFQKMSRVYDQLMKAGKFTAAQNKSEQGEYVDAISELVMICETDGFIPRFYVSKPNDKVDQTIADMKRYTRTLITEETNLGSLIEEAIKINQREDAADLLAPEDEEDIPESAVEEIEATLKDADFQEFTEFLENEEMSDNSLLEFLEEGDL